MNPCRNKYALLSHPLSTFWNYNKYIWKKTIVFTVVHLHQPKLFVQTCTLLFSPNGWIIYQKFPLFFNIYVYIYIDFSNRIWAVASHLNVTWRVICAYLWETSYREVSALRAWWEFMIIKGMQASSENLQTVCNSEQHLDYYSGKLNLPKRYLWLSQILLWLILQLMRMYGLWGCMDWGHNLSHNSSIVNNWKQCHVQCF